MDGPVSYVVDGHIASIVLNRPLKLNALNPDLIQAFSMALRRARADSEVRAVLITGAGRYFCSGADLSLEYLPSVLGVGRGEAVRIEMEQFWSPLVSTLANLGKPTVAAVNGPAVGAGVGLALACDIVIAAESSSFTLAFGPKLSIVPDTGTSWLLPRLVGPARARGLALLGDPLPAATAADWGLIWQVVADDQVVRSARLVADRLATIDSLAAKRICSTLAAALHNDLDGQLALEARVQGELTERPEFLERIAAFARQRSS